MPVMSPVERGLCQSSPWAFVAGRLLLPWGLHGVRPGGRWLEIGGGAGAMADRMLAHHPGLEELTVTDLDPEMVEAATRRLARHGERARAQVADATALPFDDDTFDGVATFLMLHHVLDWEDALTEAVRVTTPGGRIVGYDLLASAAARVLHVVDRSPHRLVDASALGACLARLPVDIERLDMLPLGAGFRMRLRAV